MHIGKHLCALLILASLGCEAVQAKVIEDVKGSLGALTSIGDALDSPDRHPVHILYIHGINEVGAGDSALLRKSICTRLKLCNVSDWADAGTEYVDKGEFASGTNPPPLRYLGAAVWNNAQEWSAAAPFVVHWVVRLRNHPSILVVDELNWWPLVLALKCRHIVTGEAYLAGPDASLLGVCSQQSMQDPGGQGRFFPWITPDKAAELKKQPARAALINRNLKGQLLDWGFSDAMLAVGGLNTILRDGLRQLIVKSVEFDPNGTGTTDPTTGPGNRQRRPYNWQQQLRSGDTVDREFVGVTHSLGSYLLFNTLNLELTNPAPSAASGSAMPLGQAHAADNAVEDEAVQYVFARTSLVYFFANQLSLLELADLEGAASPAGNASFPHFNQLVNRWAQIQSEFQSRMHPAEVAARRKIQVVAWSDPSDLLTWRVPKIGTVDVVNLYVQNALHWFWVFESPTGAHDNYAENPRVLRVMFTNTAHARGP